MAPQRGKRSVDFGDKSATAVASKKQKRTAVPTGKPKQKAPPSIKSKVKSTTKSVIKQKEKQQTEEEDVIKLQHSYAEVEEEQEYLTALAGSSSEGEQSSDEEDVVNDEKENDVTTATTPKDEFNAGQPVIQLDEKTEQQMRTKITAAQKKAASELINNPQKVNSKY
jgi:hypothetical protein